MPIATSDIVNTWFSERIASGAVARDTDAYNQVANALPELIARLDPAPPSDGPAVPTVDSVPTPNAGPATK